jgi:hypothetical protein
MTSDEIQYGVEVCALAVEVMAFLMLPDRVDDREGTAGLVDASNDEIPVGMYQHRRRRGRETKRAASGPQRLGFSFHFFEERRAEF